MESERLRLLPLARFLRLLQRLRGGMNDRHACSISRHKRAAVCCGKSDHAKRLALAAGHYQGGEVMGRMSYAIVKARASFAHWLIDKGGAIMPPGHSRGRLRNSSKEMGQALSKYGGRLATVEPTLRSCVRQAHTLKDIQHELRGAKQYEIADKVRKVVSSLENASEFCFGEVLGRIDGEQP